MRAEAPDNTTSRLLLLHRLFATFITLIAASTDPSACNKRGIALNYYSIVIRWTAGENAHARRQQARCSLKKHFTHGHTMQHHRTTGASVSIYHSQVLFITCWSAAAVVFQHLLKLSLAQCCNHCYIFFPAGRPAQVATQFLWLTKGKVTGRQPRSGCA